MKTLVFILILFFAKSVFSQSIDELILSENQFVSPNEEVEILKEISLIIGNESKGDIEELSLLNGSTSTLSSFGNYVVPNYIKFGCKAMVDTWCTNTYRIDVGSLYINVDNINGISARADCYWDGGTGDCSYGENATPINSGIALDKLIFYVGNIHFSQQDSWSWTYGEFTLYVWEYEGYDCLTENQTDRTYRDVTSITPHGCDYGDPCIVETISCDTDTSLACNGSFGDPGTGCHILDVLYTRPSGGGAYSYKIYIKVVDSVSGSVQAWDSDLGCINFYWL